MQKEILNVLGNIAETHGVTILYAAESGSRAWGFASEDSDYDVRFIYAGPVEHYLRFNIELQRDVLEPKMENPLLDISGWDIRKALGLFTRSNSTLLEWLHSPICYINPHPSIVKLRLIAENAFNPTALMFYYYRMAKHHAREFLQDEMVSLKKYLYVLRALMAVDFIRETQTLPPVDFLSLWTRTAAFAKPVSVIEGAVAELLRLKHEAKEIGVGRRIAVLDTYIARALDTNTAAFVNFKRDDLRSREWDDRLNAIFREAIGVV